MARPVRPVSQIIFLLLMTLCLGIFPLVANAQAAKPARSEAPVPLAPAPPKSPQVQTDGSVVFTLTMPNAAKVELHLEGAAQPFPMTKGPEGVWSVIVPKLAPQYYSYTFDVDGTSVLDPHNVTIKPSFFSTQNVFLVPGQPPMSWEPADVPHGTIHHHYYRSNLVGHKQRVLRLHTAQLRFQEKISRALPASWIQRRSERLDEHGQGQHHSRQPDRPGKSQADDHGDAARLRNHGHDHAGVERMARC